MANLTVKDAKSIKGTNPQYLVEKIIRTRIYDSKYWKEECFALTAELLVDKAMELRFIGGVVGGNVKPSPFLCLILKMLQIQPDKDIIVEFIKNDDYKYVRCLGAFYMRLTGTSLDCYNYLEPLLNDNRRVRRQNGEGGYEHSYVDVFVDDLLKKERMCDIILPRLKKRHILEENNEIQPRISILEADDDDDDDGELEPKMPEKIVEKTAKHSHSKKAGEKERYRSESNSKKRHRSESNSKMRHRSESNSKRRRRLRSESNSDVGHRKRAEQRRSGDRDRDRRSGHHTSSHKDTRQRKDEPSRDHRWKRDSGRNENRHGWDRDRDRERERTRDRNRDRERERTRGHDIGRSRGRGRSHDRSRDRSRDRDSGRWHRHRY